MEKSSTRKRSSRRFSKKKKSTRNQIELLTHEIDAAVDYIEKWKRREIIDLIVNSNSKKIVVIPVTDKKLIIGRHAVQKFNDLWVLLDSRFDKEYNFSCKSSAICFSVCLQRGYEEVANTILDCDSKYIKLSEDLHQYNYMKKRALTKKDVWKYDFYHIMVSNTNYKLSEAKNQLVKSLTRAKYIKIWE